MSRLTRIAVPLRTPEDVIPHLGKPTHWKQGRSAKAVADCWFHANDVPPRVKAILDQAPELRDATLIDAWLERCTDLGDSRGSPSQTDLLAVLALENELFVMGVEAKVTESFGKLVREWIVEDSQGKTDRLQKLCDLLGFDRNDVGNLRYQLFHRTAAAIIEAKRFRASKAVMIVHSFCEQSSGLSDFLMFFDKMGVRGAGRDRLSEPTIVNDVTLWIGWAGDRCPA